MITKQQLGTFTSISIFNEKYLLVERRGLFNLISNETGEYISETWFEQIKKNAGGGADFIEKKTKQRTQFADISLMSRYNHVRSLVACASVLPLLDMRCVTIVSSPYNIHTSSREIIKIVARVELLGNNLLLGENGKLYYENGNEYILPKFFISMTDINRLNSLADEVNMTYNSSYDINKKVDKETPMWIFGFNADELCFNTIDNVIIKHSETKAWGGDTIKVRFNMNRIPRQYLDLLNQQLDDYDYNSWDKEYYGEQCVWRTKLYKLNELDELFIELSCLMNKKNFI